MISLTRRAAAALLALLALAAPAAAQSAPAGAPVPSAAGLAPAPPIPDRAPWWLPALTLRMGVFGEAPDITSSCRDIFLAPGAELRTRGRIYLLAALDGLGGVLGNTLCLKVPEYPQADSVVYEDDYGIALDSSRRRMVGVGAGVPVGPVALEADLGIGQVHAGSVDGLSHRWAGGHLGLVRGHLVVHYDLGWVRVPVLREAHTWPLPHAPETMPQPGQPPFTTSVLHQWGRLRGVQLGLRF